MGWKEFSSADASQDNGPIGFWRGLVNRCEAMVLAQAEPRKVVRRQRPQRHEPQDGGSRSRDRAGRPRPELALEHRPAPAAETGSSRWLLRVCRADRLKPRLLGACRSPGRYIIRSKREEIPMFRSVGQRGAVAFLGTLCVLDRRRCGRGRPEGRRPCPAVFAAGLRRQDLYASTNSRGSRRW